MSSICNLNPAELWNIFDEICKIPHPSGQESKLGEYILDMAKQNRLDAQIDAIGNIMIKRPAAPGCEKAPRIILQGHLDMVPQVESGRDFDFSKDPVKPLVKDGWVTADGTTLGADNGIGAAAALALAFDKNLQCGPLQLLFTVEEETGLNGAGALQPEFIDGDWLLNLDSEHEQLCVGCAGGVRFDAVFPAETKPLPENFKSLKLTLSGLHGGHSGEDINKGLGNAIHLLAQALAEVGSNRQLLLKSISGGSKDNAIPRECEAVFAVSAEDLSETEQAISNITAKFKELYANSDPGIFLQLEQVSELSGFMAPAASRALLGSIGQFPCGVFKMSSEIEDMVETSANLGIAATNAGKITITGSIRSAIEAEKDKLTRLIINLFSQNGATVELRSPYPGWQPVMDSELLAAVRRCYLENYQREPAIGAVHAGLECGIIGSKNKNLQLLSIGPWIENPHSPAERVNIESVTRFMKFLRLILEKAAKGV